MSSRGHRRGMENEARASGGYYGALGTLKKLVISECTPP